MDAEREAAERDTGSCRTCATGGRLGARHAGECPPLLVIREIAAAGGIGPRGRQVRVDDPMAMTGLCDLPRAEAVLAVLSGYPFNRMLAGYRKNRCEVIAGALPKATATTPLNPAAAMRINGCTPWQVRTVVERISRDCPETQLGMI